MRTCSLALLAIAMVVAGCGRKPQLELCPAISALGHRDAQQDATKAFQSGDKRLLELGGFQPVVPGVAAPYSFRPGTKFRMLDGTSDMTTAACDDARHTAEVYARRYNQKMLELSESDSR
jgi:predicted small lipoprotein YifL